MAHELTIRDNGRAEAFYAGDGKTLNPAWHGLGTNVLDAPNSEEAIKLAGLDGEVAKVQAWAGDDRYPASDFRGVQRTDTRATLGFVTDEYEPVQNVEAFAFLDGLNQDGIVKYEAAGSLRGGRYVWVLARTHTAFTVAEGDVVQPYLLFQTSHDGSTGVTVMPTTVRVVCMNTLRAALAYRSNRLSIRHTRSVQKRLDLAREAVASAMRGTDAQLYQAITLARTAITRDQFGAYLDELFPVDDRTGVALKNQQARRIAMSNNFYDSPRQTMLSIKGTAWAAYNAVSEYIDHQASFRTAESRFASILSGTADEVKQQAFALALKF